MARKKPATRPQLKAVPPADKRKLLAFDQETYGALDMMARERMMTWQELADEAFRDLLRKHGKPVDLRDALKKSAPTAPKRK